MRNNRRPPYPAHARFHFGRVIDYCPPRSRRVQESNLTQSTNNLATAIQENAVGPKRAAGDSGSVEQHSLADQIAADKYLASKKATRSKGLGIRMTKLVPPGAA